MSLVLQGRSQPIVTHAKTYQVAEVPNYNNYKACCHFLLSEPRKYLGTQVLIWLVMALYYAICGWRAPLALLVVTAALNVVAQIAMTVLGLRDPGIIPKILKEFEK